MPKLKTSKSVKKRIRITATGKARRMRPGRSHLLTLKSSKRKRHLGKPALVSPGETKTIHKLLPYGA